MANALPKRVLRATTGGAELGEGETAVGAPLREGLEVAARIGQILGKVRRITPWMYEAHRSAGLSGTAIITMKLNKRGYIERLFFHTKTGTRELDVTAQAIIHMGEPYPYVPQELAIEIKFSPEL